MTLEEESRLSFYRELTVLDEKKNIVLVQDIRNSELCVKKTLDIYSRDVYEQLASVRIEGVPAVKECIADDGKLIVVEEYVQGRSLKQVLDEQGLLNEEQAYDIAVQLADVLVQVLGSTNETYRRHTKAMRVHCVFCCLDQTLVV